MLDTLGMVSMLVLMVTEMLRLRARLMPAVRRHRSPAELEWEQDEQEDGEPTAHRQMLAATGFGGGSTVAVRRDQGHHLPARMHSTRAFMRWRIRCS